MRIMFAMLRTMGDVILGHTICRELKEDFPDSEIHYYVNKPYGELLQNSPHVDVIHDSDDWNFDNLFMENVKEGYEKVFFPYQVRGECNMWHQFDETRRQHLLDFYWKRMGMHRSITERECCVFPSPQNYQDAQQHISFDVPRIAIHSTSGVKTKDWPYFDELIEELRKSGLAAIQVGARTDKVVRGAVDLRGKMGLLELAAFLSQCAAFVGLDSGLSYLADAVKIPTLVIQGSTSPVTSGPISPRVTHLFAPETGYQDCQEIRCHVECRHEVNCNTKITVEQVCDKLDTMISGWNKTVPVGV